MNVVSQNSCKFILIGLYKATAHVIVIGYTTGSLLIYLCTSVITLLQYHPRVGPMLPTPMGYQC